MKFQHFVNALFGTNYSSPEPARPAPGPSAKLPSASQRQMATTAMQTLRFIERSFALKLWDNSDIEKWQHDLAVMLANADLKNVRLLVLGEDQTVIYEHLIEFGGQVSNHINHAQGVELPLISPDLIKGTSVRINQNGREDVYRHLLQLAWTPAADLKRRDGADIKSRHGAKHGLATSLHVANEAMVDLTVRRIGTKGFAFARDTNQREVFIYRTQKEPPLRIGQHLRAIVVQTPRGLQARNVQTA